MAITLRMPNAASQTTVSGSLASTAGVDVWLGFVTPISTSGSCTFFRGGSEVAGSIMCSIVASPGQTIFLPYPFNAPTGGIFGGSISGGSVFWWTNLA